MKRASMTLILAVLLTFGLVTYAAAHMMGDEDGHMRGDDNSAFDYGYMGPDMMDGYGYGYGYGMTGFMSQMDTALNGMSYNSTKMNQEFNSFESQYRKMMKMQDINQIKTEMTRLYNQMQAMHHGLKQQQTMSENALSIMNNRYQDGFMGPNM